MGAICTRKSLKDNPARLAMMMLGIAHQRRGSADVGRENLRDQERDGVDPEALTDQQRHRGDEQNSGHVVQEGRGDCGDQREQDHDRSAEPRPVSMPR